MDYKNEFGFNADEELIFVNLKSNQLSGARSAVIKAILSNASITALMIFGMYFQQYWAAIVGVFWVAVLTSRQIGQYSEQAKYYNAYPQMISKIEKRIEDLKEK